MSAVSRPNWSAAAITCSPPEVIWLRLFCTLWINASCREAKAISLRGALFLIRILTTSSDNTSSSGRDSLITCT